MRRTFTTLFIFFISLTIVQAQDIHFSQFWASPLTVGPAQTGNFPGSYRAGLIYRSQWTSVNSPFKTFSAFYDMNVGGGLYSGDALSAGIVFYNDNAGDANFSRTYVLLSGAYHKALGLDNRLSLAVQAGYGQKSLDYNELLLEDMFVDPQTGFGGATNEMFPNENSGNVEINAGLDFTSLINDNLSARAGVGVWHLTSPEEDFVMGGQPYNLGMRITGHGGVDYKMNEQVSINPKFLFMTQEKAMEFNIGGDVGYKLQNESFPATLYGGLFFRATNTDAIIPYVGMEYQDFRLGLSYDVNVSELNDASNYKGGFEISLVYIGTITASPTTIIVPCIRF